MTYILCLSFALVHFSSHKVKNEQQGVPVGNNSVSRDNVVKCVFTI